MLFKTEVTLKIFARARRARAIFLVTEVLKNSWPKEGIYPGTEGGDRRLEETLRAQGVSVTVPGTRGQRVVTGV